MTTEQIEELRIRAIECRKKRDEERARNGEDKITWIREPDVFVDGKNHPGKPIAPQVD